METLCNQFNGQNEHGKKKKQKKNKKIWSSDVKFFRNAKSGAARCLRFGGNRTSRQKNNNLWLHSSVYTIWESSDST